MKDVDHSHPNYWSIYLSNCARKGDLAGLNEALNHGANLEWRHVPGLEVFATPLWWAATNGHVTIVERLADAGCDLEAKDEREGLTPLHRAAFRGFSTVVDRLLVKGANILARGNVESTPLHLAARAGKLDVVSLLLEWGASLELVNKRGETPLLCASNADVRRAILEFDPKWTGGEKKKPTFLLNPFRRLEGELAVFFETAIDCAWAHIDKPHEVYPYDLLIGAEKLLALCKVGEAMSGFSTLDPSALHESCLFNVFVTVAACIKAEIDDPTKKGSEKHKWRNLLLTTYESIYSNSQRKGIKGLTMSKITADLWDALVDMVALHLFGEIYWVKMKVFREQDAIKQRQMVAGWTKDFEYFRNQPPVVTKAELELAGRRLHALSPKGRALVSDVLPEEYDYVKMTMRQLVFSLPETTRKRKGNNSNGGVNSSSGNGSGNASSGNGGIPGSIGGGAGGGAGGAGGKNVLFNEGGNSNIPPCHPGKEYPPCDLPVLKKELTWAKLDKNRSAMKKFWSSLKDCCKKRICAIPSREYHRCLMSCEDWDILMSIHLGYEDDSFIEFDQERDVYSVGEEFLAEDGVDDMIDSFKADLDNLWNDVSKIAVLPSDACDELAMDLFELEARRLFCCRLFHAFSAEQKEKTAQQSMEKLIQEEEAEKKKDKDNKKKKQKKKKKQTTSSSSGSNQQNVNGSGMASDSEDDEDDDDKVATPPPPAPAPSPASAKGKAATPASAAPSPSPAAKSNAATATAASAANAKGKQTADSVSPAKSNASSAAAASKTSQKDEKKSNEDKKASTGKSASSAAASAPAESSSSSSKAGKTSTDKASSSKQQQQDSNSSSKKKDQQKEMSLKAIHAEQKAAAKLLRQPTSGEIAEAAKEERERVRREQEEEARALEFAMAESLRLYEEEQKRLGGSVDPDSSAAAAAAAAASFAAPYANAEEDEWKDVQKKPKRRAEDKEKEKEPELDPILDIDPDILDPSRYKTRMCSRYLAGVKCHFGSRCAFAHGDQELLSKNVKVHAAVEAGKISSKQCKMFATTGKCKEGEKCLFLHGESDPRAGGSSPSASSTPTTVSAPTPAPAPAPASAPIAAAAAPPAYPEPQHHQQQETPAAVAPAAVEPPVVDKRIVARVLGWVISSLEGHGAVFIAEIGAALRQKMGRSEYEGFVRSVGGLKAFLESHSDLFSLSGDFSRGSGAVTLIEFVPSDAGAPPSASSKTASTKASKKTKNNANANTAPAAAAAATPPHASPVKKSLAAAVAGASRSDAVPEDEHLGRHHSYDTEHDAVDLNAIVEGIITGSGGGWTDGEDSHSDLGYETDEASAQRNKGSYAAAAGTGVPASTTASSASAPVIPGPVPPSAASTVAASIPSSLQTLDFEDGMIFVSTGTTYQECMERKLLGLPRRDYKLVASVVPEKTALFLFNFTTRELHGIFVATAKGGLNLVPEAWARRPPAGPAARTATPPHSSGSPFPAQLYFRIWEKCKPIHESQIIHLYPGNGRVLHLDREMLADVLSSFKKVNPVLVSKQNQLSAAAAAAAAAAPAPAPSASSKKAEKKAKAAAAAATASHHSAPPAPAPAPAPAAPVIPPAAAAPSAPSFTAPPAAAAMGNAFGNFVPQQQQQQQQVSAPEVAGANLFSAPMFGGLEQQQQQQQQQQFPPQQQAPQPLPPFFNNGPDLSGMASNPSATAFATVAAALASNPALLNALATNPSLAHAFATNPSLAAAFATNPALGGGMAAPGMGNPFAAAAAAAAAAPKPFGQDSFNPLGGGFHNAPTVPTGLSQQMQQNQLQFQQNMQQRLQQEQQQLAGKASSNLNGSNGIGAPQQAVWNTSAPAFVPPSAQSPATNRKNANNNNSNNSNGHGKQNKAATTPSKGSKNSSPASSTSSVNTVLHHHQQQPQQQQQQQQKSGPNSSLLNAFTAFNGGQSSTSASAPKPLHPAPAPPTAAAPQAVAPAATAPSASLWNPLGNVPAANPSPLFDNSALAAALAAAGGAGLGGLGVGGVGLGGFGGGFDSSLNLNLMGGGAGGSSAFVGSNGAVDNGAFGSFSSFGGGLNLSQFADLPSSSPFGLNASAFSGLGAFGLGNATSNQPNSSSQAPFHF